mmetsp:Transcript_13798/g.31294  ORF Transcript_13798/g.31294 Transcript_13798/m.31294 type:complete len:250 (+) Transcript_13798:404-1153(+)
MEGSVYGLYAGLNFRPVMPRRRKNSRSTPMRWPRPMFLSATKPSTWWNSARCVESSVSFRKTRSIEKHLRGVKTPVRLYSWASLLSTREETAVVCVRKRFFRASSSLQLYLQPVEPLPPFSCMFFTASMYSWGRSCARAGVSMKNVSCASLAGCCWGWKSVSKFQKELSTHWFVGISSKPIWMRMLRISDLTFMSGWRLPPMLRAPQAFLKLRLLNSCSFQEPLRIMSDVISASALPAVMEKASVWQIL